MKADRSTEIPKAGLAGLKQNWSFDLISGFLVFLIALPLCLGIALAYNFPPEAGIFTAIIGGIVTTFISNSELTIKGPAAGLIVIVAGCTAAFGGDGMAGGFSATDIQAYQAALAVGLTAGVIQILFGVFRLGWMGEFFPSSVVHGMLAAIGVIIIAKQLPLALGVTAKGGPMNLILGIPQIFQHLQGRIAVVGGICVAIMFLWPLVKIKPLKKIPAAIIVLAVSIPLGQFMDLGAEHTNSLNLGGGHGAPAKAPAAADAKTDATAVAATTPAPAPQKSDTLVPVPPFGKTFENLKLPDLSVLSQGKAWYWIAMFAIIGTLESMLSAKAVDTIDPWKRKTNLDRDNLAVGVANTACAVAGAPPMISEIVRSRANIDNGARTRFADLFHALFLLSFVTLLPAVIAMIPIAALAAMLVYTGFRLAHPREFAHVYHIGPEQLIIFVSTIIGVLATDLMIGVFIGIGVKLVLHIFNGVPIQSLFWPFLEVSETPEGTYLIEARHSAVFSNWLLFKRRVEKLGLGEHRNVIVDLSGTKFVDHSVMEKLGELKREFESQQLTLSVVGLDDHRPVSEHPTAARKLRRA